MAEKHALREVLQGLDVTSVSDAELNQMIAAGIKDKGTLAAVCHLPDAMTQLMTDPPGLSLGMAALLCKRFQAGN